MQIESNQLTVINYSRLWKLLRLCKSKEPGLKGSIYTQALIQLNNSNNMATSGAGAQGRLSHCTLSTASSFHKYSKLQSLNSMIYII